MSSQSVNPLLPPLARVCGRTLLLSYVLSLFFVLFPLNLTSAQWGSQLSNRIVDSTSVALVGVALLCCAAFTEIRPDPESAPHAAAKLDRQRRFALRLCRWGVIGLALLALWQLPLFLGNTLQINRQSFAELGQLSPVLEKTERSIRESSPEMINQRWNSLIAAGAPGLKKSLTGTEERRAALLQTIQLREKQLDRTVTSRINRVRLSLGRDSLRRIGLCFVYGYGFFALRRSILWTVRDPSYLLTQQATPVSTADEDPALGQDPRDFPGWLD